VGFILTLQRYLVAVEPVERAINPQSGPWIPQAVLLHRAEIPPPSPYLLKEIKLLAGIAEKGITAIACRLAVKYPCSLMPYSAPLPSSRRSASAAIRTSGG
jgi:hypothetical protein